MSKFSFNTTAPSSIKKNIGFDTSQLKLFIDHRVKYQPYVLFLLEDTCGWPFQKKRVTWLDKIIKVSGCSSYLITSAVNFDTDEAEVSKKGIYKFYEENGSGWQALLNDKDHKCKCIVPFGYALNQIIKGNDVSIMDFWFPYFKNYFYLGDEFLGNYNTFIMPMFGWRNTLISVSGTEEDLKDSSLTTWKISYFRRLLKILNQNKLVLPEDMGPYNVYVVQSPEEAIALFKSKMSSEYCSFDLETGGGKEVQLDFLLGYIKCLTICWDTTDTYYIDWKRIMALPEVLKTFNEMFRSCKHRIGVNAKFDIKYLWQNGVDKDIEVTDDVMLMAHAACSTRRKGLKSMAFYYTYLGGYDDDLDVYKKQTGNDDYGKIPEKILSKYAALDALVALRCYFACKHEIEAFDKAYPTEKPLDILTQDNWHIYTVWSWYQDMMMRFYPVICDMEFRGIYISDKVRAANKAYLDGEIAKTKAKLREIFNVGEDFKWESTKDLGELLRKSGWPVIKESENGGMATDDDSFFRWGQIGLKGVEEIKYLRACNTCANSFLGNSSTSYDKATGKKIVDTTGWVSYMRKHPEDGSLRIHTNYSIMGTETFRNICRDPNFQNIPSHTVVAEYVKQAVSVPPAPLYTITSESGKKYECIGLDKIRVVGKGYVNVSDLTENDTIDESDDKVVFTYEEFEKQEMDTLWKQAYDECHKALV